ncbi:DUF3598 family protein [Leptolyngbya sp. FACHB-261]|uniref:DUF3598 family protein n=1 Tax=Leptolyngbya sp. FACHB-261 TaxID=2692806 RepID=UPI001688F2C5|nr:DUF3598 family protein [Leptolyngbya sp. FACHB-261]MBD2104639.1 DUF3598 family protein [Leptolyngbya sp. FACHB-261]
MRTQWESLLQNLGQWQGSFMRLSAQAELLEDIPSLVSLEGLNDNNTIRQTVRRFLPDAAGKLEPQDKVFEYSSLNRATLFFENGAFSQGSIQLAPFAEFGAEFGFIEGERRLRLVQLFNPDGELQGFTLIREKQLDTNVSERPALRVEDLLGEWHGEAVSLYPDLRSPETYPTKLRLEREGDQLSQQLTYPGGEINSTARIEGNILRFEQGSQPIQVLLLPDGASSTTPLRVKVGQPLFLEAGWLRQYNIRQRMVRSYDTRGGWTSLTLVTEHRRN